MQDPENREKSENRRTTAHGTLQVSKKSENWILKISKKSENRIQKSRVVVHRTEVVADTKYGL